MTKIQLAALQNLAAIITLHGRIHPFASEAESAGQQAWWRRAIACGAVRCILAHDGMVVGVAAQGTTQDRQIDHGLIDMLMVDPDCQGLGFGRVLVNTILAENDRAGRATALYVFNENARAIRLYRDLGFRDESGLHPDKLPGLADRKFLYMVREPRAA